MAAPGIEQEIWVGSTAAEKPYDIASPVVCIGLAAICVAATAVYGSMFAWHTSDMDTWFIPWLHAILAQGAVRSLAEPMKVVVEGTNGYANYNPPYLYLLIIASTTHSILQSMTIVKLVAVLGNLFCSVCTYRLMRCFLDPKPALLAAALTLLLPTLALNAAAWGQSDAIYTGFTILAVACAIRGEWVSMMAALGAGLAFKLQAALIGPFVLYVLVSRRMPPWTLAVPPLVYILFVLPAWLAGRPAWELANVYTEQANAYHWLSMNAPNLWLYIQHFHLLSYQQAVVPGTLLAAAVGLVIAGLAFRVRLDNAGLLLLATFSATAIPYLLPKMHDRYFMIAEVLSYCLAVTRLQGWALVVAGAMQLGSVGAYASLLFGFRVGTYLGVLPIGAALVVLAVKLSDEIRRSKYAKSPPRFGVWRVTS